MLWQKHRHLSSSGFNCYFLCSPLQTIFLILILTLPFTLAFSRSLPFNEKKNSIHLGLCMVCKQNAKQTHEYVIINSLSPFLSTRNRTAKLLENRILLSYLVLGLELWCVLENFPHAKMETSTPLPDPLPSI